MTSICFYFEVHQPLRLRRYSYFDIGKVHDYFDSNHNGRILDKVADKCYLPANDMMLRLIEEHKGSFRIAYSISGLLLDQLELRRPDVLNSFKELAQTGCVEFLNETYYHSLAFIFSPEEFKKQVVLHRDRIRELFGQTATSFRHTEFIYNNALAKMVETMGYRVILTEGADKILAWRRPDYVYQARNCGGLRMLLRNYRLSDDIAFRFSNHDWPEFPLTVDKYVTWLNGTSKGAQVINLFMDYETFGEHQWHETGIFEFFNRIPGEVLKNSDFRFQTPSEAAADHLPVAALDVPNFISWADEGRDLTAWLGNSLQRDASRAVFELEKDVLACGDGNLLHAWRAVQTSDHFYYMCTKWFSDGDVHKYFNPYPSPYDAYINYMNIIDDLSRQVGMCRKNREAVDESTRSASHDTSSTRLPF